MSIWKRGKMLKNEWKAILKHKFFIIIIIALGLVPAIYNYIFLGSMWNPYGNLNHLPVAVVNLDKASKLNGENLNLGNQLTSGMKKTKDLDYHFVSEKQASEGLKSGKYYMKITFPKSLSKNAASLMSKHPKEVRIDYQTTSGQNYISSKMSESAMKQLEIKISKNVTQKYTQAIFSKLTTLKSGMQKASDGSVKLAQGSQSALTGSSELSTNLKTLASSSLTFKSGAQSLQVGLNQYLAGVETAQAGAAQLSTGQTQFSAASTQLASGTQRLTDKSKTIQTGLTQLQSGISSANDLQAADQQLLTGLSELNSGTNLTDVQKQNISNLETGLTQLNAAILSGAADTSVATAVQADLTQVQAAFTDQVNTTAAAVEKTDAFKNLDADNQAQILAAIQNSAESSSSMQAAIDDVSTQLQALQTQSDALAESANEVLPASNSTLGELSSGMNQAHSAIVTKLLPGANQITLGMNQFSQKLESGSNQLSSGFNQFASGVSEANSGAQQLAENSKELVTGSLQLNAGLEELQQNDPSLASGSSDLSNGASQLFDGAVKLSDGGATLNQGLTTLNSGTQNLSVSLNQASNELATTNSAKKNAKHVAAPLSVKHTDKDNVPENGVGMAPYMICVALFVGAIATNIVIGTSFSGKQWKSGREFMLAKIGTNGVVALLQALIVYAAVYLLGLRANYTGLTILTIILISFAFMALVTFIVTWLGKVGSFVSLILLVLQLATSAGTYPLQLSYKIFQEINPWLPMTYALRMLRQTISLSGNIGFYVLGFVVMIAFFTGLLSLFKKMSRLA